MKSISYSKVSGSLFDQLFVDASGNRIARSTKFESQTVSGFHDLADTDILYLLVIDLLRITDIDIELEQARTGIDDVFRTAGDTDDVIHQDLTLAGLDEVESQEAVIEHGEHKHDDKSAQADDQNGADRRDQGRVADVDDEIRETARHGDDRIADAAGEAKEGFKVYENTGTDADDDKIEAQ